MELWEAVKRTLDTKDYDNLIDKPDAAIPKIVAKAAEYVGEDIDTDDKYVDVKRDKAQYLEHFKQDATAFLTDYATQMPKGSFVRPSLDTTGAERPGKESRPLKVSDLAGIHEDKYMSSTACKAGLWWAKNEGKPVYYCLDGLDMQDVTNYKAVKNKAIEAFLADGGALNSTKQHREVVTIQELREILKNWDELSGTVKFVQKGEILKGKAMEDGVADWKREMEASNSQAGRTPAPPKADFAKQLAAIEPMLMNRLEEVARMQKDPADSDKDARDIIRKSGHLLKIAGTRPEYVLKYIMSKCEVLMYYLLIPKDLPDAAAKFGKLASLERPAKKSVMSQAGTELVAQINLCPQVFRLPLSEALVRHPMIARDKRLAAALQQG